jgi:hypothetical protein
VALVQKQFTLLLQVELIQPGQLHLETIPVYNATDLVLVGGADVFGLQVNLYSWNSNI